MTSEKFSLSFKSTGCVSNYQSGCYSLLQWYTLGCASLRMIFNQQTKRSGPSRMHPSHKTCFSELHFLLRMWAALTNFIPKLSTLAHPLCDLLSNKPWKWNPSCNKASWDVRRALTTETVLAHYNPSLTNILVQS